MYFSLRPVPDPSCLCCRQEALWAAVKSGLVDMVVSDHSPCTLDLKQPGVMDFMEAWGGIASVQFGKWAIVAT